MRELSTGKPAAAGGHPAGDSPASGVAEAVVARKSVDEEVRHGKVSLESARKAAVPGFGVLRRGGTDSLGGNWWY